MHVVRREAAGRPPREQQRAEHLEAAPDRHDQRRAEPGARERALELGDAVLGAAEILDDARLTRAHRAPRHPLVRAEHARAERAAIRQRGERMHEIAALLAVRETDGDVVVRQRAAGLVGQRLEEMRRHRRAGHHHEQLSQAREPLGQAHVGTWRPQCSRTSVVSCAPSGTGSIGPTIET